ncbi:MAG: PepSY domain-containing protein [Phycisphaerae bacterium]
MKVRSMLLGVLGAGLIGAMAVWAAEKEEKEQKVTLDQVPAAVKATILKEAAGGKVGDVEREVKGGKTVYEADVEKDGKEFELKVAEDGTLIARKAEGKEKGEGKEEKSEEQEIPADKVPAKAREALQKQAGDAKITKYTCEKEDGVETFEAEWTVDGLARSAEVTADGSLLEIEEQLAPKDVPAAVQKAVARMLPGATDVVVEKKIKVEYEVKGKVKGKEREIVLNAAGQCEDEHEGDEEHEEKEKEEK